MSKPEGDISRFRKKLFEKELGGGAWTASVFHAEHGLPEHLPISTVLNWKESQMSPQGRSILRFLEQDSQSRSDYRDLCWRVQAYLEFQDLMSLELPLRAKGSDVVWHRHYCYLESVRILQEMIRSGLEGYFHGALGLGRSFIELSLLELYFTERSGNEGSWKCFAQWFRNKTGPPTFGHMLEYLFSQERLRRLEAVHERLRWAYKASSIYVHKPRPTESITVYSKSNVVEPSLESIYFWVFSTSLKLQSVLWAYAAFFPQSLFPVEVTRKFGFNAPIGMYFDTSNGAILRRALGEDDWAALREDLAEDPRVEQLLEWYDERPEIGEEELERTWQSVELETPSGEASLPGRSEKERRTALAKAHSRALLWAITMREAVQQNVGKDDLPALDRSRLSYRHLRSFVSSKR